MGRRFHLQILLLIRRARKSFRPDQSLFLFRYYSIGGSAGFLGVSFFGVGAVSFFLQPVTIVIVPRAITSADTTNSVFFIRFFIFFSFQVRSFLLSAPNKSHISSLVLAAGHYYPRHLPVSQYKNFTCFLLPSRLDSYRRFGSSMKPGLCGYKNCPLPALRSP
jgi:hypothetical protein